MTELVVCFLCEQLNGMGMEWEWSGVELYPWGKQASYVVVP
jgi:hypothetical protein